MPYKLNKISNMKKYPALLAAFAICMLLSCSHRKSKVEMKEDPGNIVVPSNSDATNPSLADTAYKSKDSLKK
jgi:hypothetical protein